MSTPEIIDSVGNRIATGSLLGKGGEGAVYIVPHSAGVVVKIYHKPLDAERAGKILAMARIKSDALVKLTAWPTELVRLKSTGQPIGLLMKQVGGHNVHHLYGPKSRLQDFPTADWRFLVHAAANIARGFAVVHEAGCVIGDVNHGSLMVAQDSTVQLVDCDSFQVSSANQHFLCDKGVETFTPPELQGVSSFRGIKRTANCDNFGLAVLIFHLLFMGRHPFAGRFLGSGDMPISRAIKEFRFPYSVNRKAMQMEPPPGTPALDYAGPEISRLFEAAFSKAGMTGERPTAKAWVAGLAALEKSAVRCSSHPGHWHPSHAKRCPWCQMETLGARSLFPYPLSGVGVGVAAGAAVGSLNVGSLWQDIQRLTGFVPRPEATRSNLTPSAEARAVGRPSEFTMRIPAFVAVAVFLAGMFFFPQAFVLWVGLGFGVNSVLGNMFKSTRSDRAAPFQRAMIVAKQARDEIEREWNLKTNDSAFLRARDQFLAAKKDLEELPRRRLAAIDRLKSNQRKLQLDRFLDRFELEDAKIDGIGAGRKRILESYGIETAEDCTAHRINAVPGFGPKMIERLVKWRRGIEAKFVFDPDKAIDPRDFAAVEQDFLKQRSRSEAAAKSAHLEVMQAHARITRERALLQPKLKAAQEKLDQAQADYAHVSG